MSQKTAQKKAVARKDMTKAQWTWKEMKRRMRAMMILIPVVVAQLSRLLSNSCIFKILRF